MNAHPPRWHRAAAIACAVLCAFRAITGGTFAHAEDESPPAMRVRQITAGPPTEPAASLSGELSAPPASNAASATANDTTTNTTTNTTTSTATDTTATVASSAGATANPSATATNPSAWSAGANGAARRSSRRFPFPGARPWPNALRGPVAPGNLPAPAAAVPPAAAITATGSPLLSTAPTSTAAAPIATSADPTQPATPVAYDAGTGWRAAASTPSSDAATPSSTAPAAANTNAAPNSVTPVMPEDPAPTAALGAPLLTAPANDYFAPPAETPPVPVIQEGPGNPGRAATNTNDGPRPLGPLTRIGRRQVPATGATPPAAPATAGGETQSAGPARPGLGPAPAGPAGNLGPEEDLTPVPAPNLMPSSGPLSFEVIEHTGEMQVMLRRSKILRTPFDIYRTAVVDPRICNVVQFTPREVSIIGQAQGSTHVTFWFEDGQNRPVTYLVRVVPDVEVQKRREEQYDIFEEILAELFPDSKVHLVPVSDKLIVRGQAKDAEEASQILAVIRNQAGGYSGAWGTGGGGGGGWGGGGFGGGWGGSLSEGQAAEPFAGQNTDGTRALPSSQIINMLRVPGVQQVALRVKIAELNRTKARRYGVDLNMSFADGNVLLQSMLNASAGSMATILGAFDGDRINFGVHYLEQEGVIRLLSEPTLVTLSGRPASFVAGGEFAVPTTVGVGGAAAVTTDFRSFGAIITFLPVVIDKDRVRLQVSPEFSQVNRQLSVNNIPGLSSRAVTTTVEMREGQTLAIAGLLDDSMNASLSGNVPFLYRVFGLRNLNRSETELIILVTPELVQPMEPEEVPPLPGFDVTEPSNAGFFLLGRLEGQPTLDYRSTVWPRLKQRYRTGGPAMISGPFGHGQ